MYVIVMVDARNVTVIWRLAMLASLRNCAPPRKTGDCQIIIGRKAVGWQGIGREREGGAT